MRPVKKLPVDAFRAELATPFAQMADKREPCRLSGEMPAGLMSAFALLFFPHPSLWKYQRRMQQRTGQSKLERGCQVKELPSATQRREL